MDFVYHLRVNSLIVNQRNRDLIDRATGVNFSGDSEASTTLLSQDNLNQVGQNFLKRYLEKQSRHKGQ
jgi:uncharacterized protein with von Willebrand factor type A (vWA) domain